MVGSASVVHALARRDSVDEYRVKIFPSIVGAGTRLFEHGSAPVDMRVAALERSGGAALLRFERAMATG